MVSSSKTNDEQDTEAEALRGFLWFDKEKAFRLLAVASSVSGRGWNQFLHNGVGLLTLRIPCRRQVEEFSGSGFASVKQFLKTSFNLKTTTVVIFLSLFLLGVDFSVCRFVCAEPLWVPLVCSAVCIICVAVKQGLVMSWLHGFVSREGNFYCIKPKLCFSRHLKVKSNLAKL